MDFGNRNNSERVLMSGIGAGMMSGTRAQAWCRPRCPVFGGAPQGQLRLAPVPWWAKQVKLDKKNVRIRDWIAGSESDRFMPKVGILIFFQLKFCESGSGRIGIISIGCKAKLYVFPDNFNILSKILKIITPMMLSRKIKQCKLVLLWIKVKTKSDFPTCAKVVVVSGSGST